MENILPSGVCAITNGPPKYDFQASLFDKKTVEFSINLSSQWGPGILGKKFNVSIHLAGPEDGSSDSWIGEFLIQALPGSTDAGKSEKRAFYYNTRTRKGSVNIAGRKWELV